MGIPVLIIGKSGSGKSTAMRNLDPDKVGVLNVASKPLPFRNSLKCVNHASYKQINQALKANNLKCYVLDDTQYLLTFEAFARVSELGYQKFTDMAVNFYNLIQTVINNTSEDTIVYFLHHSEDDDKGNTKAKTLGKMLDNQLTLEGLFSIVLMAINSGGEYGFITHSDGSNTVKTPLDMFKDNIIDNDLKMVDDTIREYYGFNKEEKKK